MASDSNFNDITRNAYDELIERIEKEFQKIVGLVLERMKSLFIEFRGNLVEIQDKVERGKQASMELHSVKEKIEDMRENELKPTKEKLLSDIDEKFEDLSRTRSRFMYEFEIDLDNIKQEISNWGRIVKTNKIPNYSDMKYPVVAVGKKGNGRDELNGPRGVAYEERSGLIFVCDSFNSMIKMFNSAGDFVDDFGYTELVRPWGILLHESNIYVTDIEKCSILKYQRDGFQFMKRVGKIGSGVDQFNTPGQLTMGSDQRLYVPESENNRISVLDSELIL